LDCRKKGQKQESAEGKRRDTIVPDTKNKSFVLDIVTRTTTLSIGKKAIQADSPSRVEMDFLSLMGEWRKLLGRGKQGRIVRRAGKLHIIVIMLTALGRIRGVRERASSRGKITVENPCIREGHLPKRNTI